MNAIDLLLLLAAIISIVIIVTDYKVGSKEKTSHPIKIMTFIKKEF